MRIVLWVVLAALSLFVSSRIYVEAAPTWLILGTAVAMLLVAGVVYRFRHVLLSRRHALLTLGAISYLVAWNRGFPMMYAFSAMFFGLWLLGMVMPRLTLRRVLLHRAHRPSAVEGDSIDMSFVLHNVGRGTVRFVEVRDVGPGVTPMALVARLVSGERKEVRYAMPCQRRGVFQLGPVRLASGFPLGLATKEIEAAHSVSTLWIYPRIYPVRDFPLYGEKHQSWQGVPSPRAGMGDDFAGVREYRTGDSPRHIHWRASARMGELVVREFERRSVTTVTIFLDLEQQNYVGSEGEATLDYAARIAASIAQYALERGHSVQLAGMGQERWFLEAVEGPDAIEPILQALAAVYADGATPFGVAVSQLARLVPAQTSAVLIPTELPGLVMGPALASLQQRAAYCVTVALDGESFLKAADGPSRVSATAHRGGQYYRVRQGDDLSRVFAA